MTTLAYTIGDRPVLVATFTDVDGVLADPSAITFSLKAPDGTVVTATQAAAVNSSTGVWEWQFPSSFDQHGTWIARAAGTAGVQSALEVEIRVLDSAFD